MDRILRGEIRWANLDPVQGSEQAGRRPVLILSRDLFNERSGTVINGHRRRLDQPRAEGRFTIHAGIGRHRFAETLLGQDQPDSHAVGPTSRSEARHGQA